MMANRKAKVDFSDAERDEVLKAFEGGMNSVSIKIDSLKFRS